MDIGPGDWVERVEFCDDVPIGTVALVVKLSKDGECECGYIGPALIIKGIPAGGRWEGWCPMGWRPIYRPKAFFVEGLKQPLKESIDAD